MADLGNLGSVGLRNVVLRAGKNLESEELRREQVDRADAAGRNQILRLRACSDDDPSPITLYACPRLSILQLTCCCLQTAKHCEGFAMFETAALMRDCWDFNDSGLKPPGIKPCEKPYHYSSHEAFGRDIVGELITAARKGGILPGLVQPIPTKRFDLQRKSDRLDCL